jgi:hypothetical protein
VSPCRVTKPAVIRFQGVQRRADSVIYQFVLKAPADLRAHFPTGWAARQSLKTSDLREANDKAKALQAEWAGRFRALREDKPQPVDAHELRTRFLARVAALLPEFDRRAALLTPDDRVTNLGTLQWQLAEASDALAEGRVPDWAEEQLDRWGYARSRVADAEAMPYLVLTYELTQHEGS